MTAVKTAKKTIEIRDEYLGVRFFPDEFKAIGDSAKTLGIPMSSYVRMIVREKLSAEKKI